MCILCTARNWCRRGAAMLPWLVIPLVGLWALTSLLLPPRFRIEVTSPRLACVIVLLATLFWYEIVVPRLSVWRARRSARLRERRLSQAIELQKLRKTATRRCRNCLTPYRDQNPGGGGRFMCSNCGHVSKRPILELPGAGATGSDLAGRSGWICSQDWAPYGNGNGNGNGNWVERCSTENVLVSACMLLSGIFSYVWWMWRKAVMIGSSQEDGSSDEEGKGFSLKKGESGENSPENRSEKARRKAEEKRQARLEKEMLEEEERKQREEVARLVEERRKLRDEMLEAEKESLRRSASAGKRDSRKGAEKRRHESRKEDKGSNKSNSDGEELEKRVTREREGKHAFDKKSENENRIPHKSLALDRLKGPFQSSYRGFGAATSITKTSKPTTGLDHGQIYGNRKDTQFSGHATVKATPSGDDRKIATNFHRHVESDVHPRPAAQKKSWLQLFTRSPAVSPCPDANITNCLNNNSQLQSESVQITDQRMPPNYSLDNQINLGQSLPFTAYPSNNYSFLGDHVSQLATDHMPPFFKNSTQDMISDDADVFEDPCFIPDPVRLLGPVSESLDNFPLDLGPGFLGNNNMEEPRFIKNVPASVEVSKPSPIESPLSRLRVPEERHYVSGQLSRALNGSNLDESCNTHEQGTWQMWGSPQAQDGLGLVGGTNWFSHLGQIKSNQEDTMHSLLHEPMISHVAKENHLLAGIQAPPSLHSGNYWNSGICSPLGQLPDNNDLWMQRTLFHPLIADGKNHACPLNQMDNLALNEMDNLSVKEVVCDNSNGSASSHNSELSPSKTWFKGNDASNGPQDGGNTPVVGPFIGGLFPANLDVQPVWSFN